MSKTTADEHIACAILLARFIDLRGNVYGTKRGFPCYRWGFHADKLGPRVLCLYIGVTSVSYTHLTLPTILLV